MVPNATAGGNLDVRPVSPAESMSSHPEAVAQGLGQGVTSLAGGLISGYKDWMKNNPQPKTPSIPYQYSSPQQATQFAQNVAPQVPSFYSGNPSLSDIANVGTGMNFLGNPFLQQ